MHISHISTHDPLSYNIPILLSQTKVLLTWPVAFQVQKNVSIRRTLQNKSENNLNLTPLIQEYLTEG